MQVGRWFIRHKNHGALGMTESQDFLQGGGLPRHMLVATEHLKYISILEFLLELTLWSVKNAAMVTQFELAMLT